MTDEEMKDQVGRALVVATAGAVLLDAAYAVKKGTITPEAYAQLMNECIALSDCARLPFNEIEAKSNKIMDAIEMILPMGSDPLTPEQKRKMI